MTPSDSERLKLQFVLRSPELGSVDKTALVSRLEGLGMTLTAVGLATASGEIPAKAFRSLWGEPPAVGSGFADQLDTPDLVVPKSLGSLVQSVSLVPRHLNLKLGREP